MTRPLVVETVGIGWCAADLEHTRGHAHPGEADRSRRLTASSRRWKEEEDEEEDKKAATNQPHTSPAAGRAFGYPTTSSVEPVVFRASRSRCA